MRVFHGQAERPAKVVAVEEPFSIEIYDPVTGVVLEERLVGVLDAVVEDRCWQLPNLGAQDREPSVDRR